MERHCKNCNHMLYVSHTHCSHCGAKWVEKRITIGNVATDFSDMYLGFDNKFLVTMRDLLLVPEQVINGYIEGVRMRYVDALRFLLFSLFISGIYVFILKQIGSDAMMDTVFDFYQSLGMTPEMIEDAKVKMGDDGMKVMDYQGLYYALILPLFAIIGLLIFNMKRYNFTEHLVFYMYSVSFMIISTTLISIPMAFLAIDYLMAWSFFAYIFIFLYCAYAYKRCFEMSFVETLWRSSLAFALTFFAIIILLIIVSIVAAIAGYLSAASNS